MRDAIVQALGVTLSVTVQQLGGMPDEAGAKVKKILAGNDSAALMALGCYLDNCRKEKSYDPLVKGLTKMESRDV